MVRLEVSTGKTFYVDFLKFTELVQVIATQTILSHSVAPV
jgi:hypothetical protein